MFWLQVPLYLPVIMNTWIPALAGDTTGCEFEICNRDVKTCIFFFDFPIGPNWAGVFNFKIITYYHESIGSLQIPKWLQNSRSERGRNDYCTAQRKRHDINVSCILYIYLQYILCYVRVKITIFLNLRQCMKLDWYTFIVLSADAESSSLYYIIIRFIAM